jgi:hypothetical protein
VWDAGPSSDVCGTVVSAVLVFASLVEVASSVLVAGCGPLPVIALVELEVGLEVISVRRGLLPSAREQRVVGRRRGGRRRCRHRDLE